MDREFIREYCETTYPELEVTAVRENKEYQRLKKIFRGHEREFEKTLGNHTLFMMYEDLLSDFMDMQREISVGAYLPGAEDREKMLR